MLKLIPREVALNLIGRNQYDRLRNYEIEHQLDEDSEDEHVVQGWCPFNGIHCKFFDYSDKTWLLPALESHQKEVDEGRMRPNVVESIKARLMELCVEIPVPEGLKQVAGGVGTKDEQLTDVLNEIEKHGSRS